MKVLPLFSDNIFTPLKMDDTGFQVPKEKTDRLAHLYKRGADGKLLLHESTKESPYTNGKNFPRGNGGLASTANDYMRFAKMIANGGSLEGVKILKKETVTLMTSNQLPLSQLPIHIGGQKLEGQGFGLGFGVLTANPPFGMEGGLLLAGSCLHLFLYKS